MHLHSHYTSDLLQKSVQPCVCRLERGIRASTVSRIPLRPHRVAEQRQCGRRGAICFMCRAEASSLAETAALDQLIDLLLAARSDEEVK